MNYPVLYGLAIAIVFGIAAPAAGQVADEPGTARLAKIYESSGKYEDALRYYNDLMRTNPQDRTHFDGAYRCMMKLKQYSEAIDLISQRIEKYPTDPALYIQRGSARFNAANASAGQPGGPPVSAAFDDWDKAVSLQAKNPAVYQSIAEELVNVREYSKAIEYYERGEDESGQPNLFAFNIARAYAQSNRFREAMREYVGYLVEQPSSLWQIQQYIALYANLPDALREARDEARIAADANSGNAQVQFLYAWLCMEAKDYESALGVYVRIDNLKKSGGRELLSFGRRAFDEGAYRTAQAAFRRLMSDYPEAQFAAEAEFYHARSVEAVNEPGLPKDADDPTLTFLESIKAGVSSEAIPGYQGAIKLYQAIQEKYSNHPVSYESGYRIGRLLFTKFRDNDAALAILLKVAKPYRESIGRMDADMLIGDVYLASGNLEEAKKTYAFVSSYPAVTEEVRNEAQFRIAEIHYFEGLFADAVKELEPLTTNSNRDIANDALELKLFVEPNMSQSEAALKQFARAQLLERQGKYNEAAAMMNDITVSFPTSPILERAYFALALDHRRSGKPEDAQRSLKAFLDRFADSILRDKVLFTLADIHEQDLNNAAGAIELYTRILSEFPNSIYSGIARERILALRKGHS